MAAAAAAATATGSYSILSPKHNLSLCTNHQHHPCKNVLGFISENPIPVRSLSLLWSRPAKVPMKVFATSAMTPVIETSKSNSSDAPPIVDVDLGDRSYPIYIGFGLLNQPDLLQRCSLSRFEPVEEVYQTHATPSLQHIACESTSNPERTIDVKELVLKLRSSLKMIVDGKTAFKETIKVAKERFAENDQLQKLQHEFSSIIHPIDETDKQNAEVATVVEDIVEEIAREHEIVNQGVEAGGEAEQLQLVVTPQNSGKHVESCVGQDDCIDDLPDSQFWVHPLVQPHFESASTCGYY